MVKVIKVTKDDVTIAGAVQKRGTLIEINRVSAELLARIEAGEVAGVSLVEGSPTLPPAAPPITLGFRDNGDPIHLYIDQPTPEVQVGEATGVSREGVTFPADGQPHSAYLTGAGSLLEGTVDEVVERLQGIDSAGLLSDVREAEGKGKNRKGVLTAIDERMEGLG